MEPVRRYCLPISLLLTLCAAAAAQEPSLQFEHLTVEDGLSQGMVSTVLQDRRGFMWFGTREGLNRYDGYTVEVYQHDPDDPSSLRNSEIRTLLEDRNGLIWVGQRSGLSCFNPMTETFVHYWDKERNTSGLARNPITSLFEDRRGVLWAGLLGGGLNRFDPATGTFTRLLPDPEAPGENFVWSVLEDTQGVLWVGTWDGLFRYDRATDTFTRFRLAPADQTPQEANWVRTLYEDARGRLWIGAWGLHRFDRATETFEGFYVVPEATEPDRNGANWVQAIAEDHAGTLWVGTSESLYQFDRATGRFSHHPHKPTATLSQGEGYVATIVQDRQGVLWVGGTDVSKADLMVRPVIHYPAEPSNPSGLLGGAPRGMHLDRDDVLWIGTTGGVLNRFDRRRGTYTHYGPASDPRRPISGEMRAVHRDRRGRLWIGTDVLNRFDENEERFLPYPHARANTTSTAATSVTVIYEDHVGQIWIGTLNDGLHRLHAEGAAPGSDPGQAFTRYIHDPDDATSISSNWIRALYEDHAGRLWIGTGEGLNQLDRPPAGYPAGAEASSFVRYQHDPDDAHSLSNDRISGLYERPQEPGILWVGTSGGGLNRLDVQTGHFTRFTAQNSGLPSNVIYGILGDDEGRLWASTNHGITRFHPGTGAVGIFELGEFDLFATHRGYNGELFFGRGDGVYAVAPGEVRGNPLPPQVSLTGLRVFGEPVRPSPDGPLRAPLALADEVRLDHHQNDVTFEYVGLHFSRPKDNQYAYKLDGYEEAWRYVGAQRTAIYPNLPPGTYAFRVKAANADGVWNEEGIGIRLVVVPPWWQRAWFYALAVLGLLGLTVMSYRWRVRLLTARARELEAQVDDRTRELVAEKQKTEAQARRLAELDEAKSRFFANVSHEFRTPLTLLLSPLDEALEGTYGALPAPMQRQARVMRRNARRLLRLVNQLLDLSKLESGKLELDRRPGDLVPFLRALVRSFAPLAERRRIALQFQPVADALPLAFDRDAVEKIVSNLLSNALKFTPEGGHVWVTASVGGDTAEVVVKDTGPGIPPGETERIFDRFEQVDASTTRAHGGTGIGLALARELVVLHGGTLGVESEVGFGSAFVVRLALDLPNEAPEAETPAAGDGAALLEHTALIAGAAEERQAARPDPSDARPAVLVVEDNADVRTLLRETLQAAYHVLEAVDGVEGLEATRAHRPALVVSDVMMPRMDGFALCRQIKSDEALRATPVLLLTARAAEADRIHGLEGGADDYVAKPFSTRELLVRATNLILSRRRLREQFSREVVVRPSEVVIPSEDEALVERVLGVLEAHFGDGSFSVEHLADELGLSRRQCYRRVKAVTGETPAELLRRLRLERASQLLAAHPGTVAEVAYAVGFRSPSHFAAAFRKVYGVAPSEHRAGEE